MRDEDAAEASISPAASVYDSEKLSVRNGNSAGSAPFEKSVPRCPAARADIAPLWIPERTIPTLPLASRGDARRGTERRERRCRRRRRPRLGGRHAAARRRPPRRRADLEPRG